MVARPRSATTTASAMRSPRGVRWVGTGRVAVVSTSDSEVGQDGEDAAVLLVGRRQAELEEHLADVLLDPAAGDDEALGDRGVGVALGHEAEHLALAWSELVEDVGASAPAQELGDDLGV